MSDEPFRITKTIDGATFYYDGPGTTWEVSYGLPGSLSPYYPGHRWEKLGASETFLSRDQIDLAGFSSDERTLFFATQLIQRAAPYSSTVMVDPNIGGALVSEFVLITDIPLANPINGGVPPFNAQTAGFNNTEDEYTNVKLAIGTMWSQTTTSPLGLVNADRWEFGSGDPTASDTLYMYRYVTLTAGVPAPSDAISIPAVRYVATGVSTQESDLVYVNRLRRSYEQQR